MPHPEADWAVLEVESQSSTTATVYVSKYNVIKDFNSGFAFISFLAVFNFASSAVTPICPMMNSTEKSIHPKPASQHEEVA